MAVTSQPGASREAKAGGAAGEACPAADGGGVSAAEEGGGGEGGCGEALFAVYELDCE